MRKRLLGLGLAVVLVLSAGTAGAQIINPPGPVSLTASGSTCATVGACAVFNVGNFPSLTMQVSGTYTGQIEFEATSNGNTWLALQMVNTATGAAATNTTGTGMFTISNSGYLQVRARASALSAGQPTVTAARGQESAFTPANVSGITITNADGAILDGATPTIKGTVADLTNSNPVATMVVDANGTQITSFGGGTQYAVDAALGATPTGTLAVAIRDDVLSALTPVEGDAIGVRVDANGALWVIPSGTTVVGDGSGALTVDNGGTFAVQAASTQSGTWTVQPGNTANTTPWLATIAQGGLSATVRDTGTSDSLNVSIVDAAGAQITAFGGGTQFAEDVASADGNVGTLAMVRRTATPANTSGADGDYETLQMNAGRLWTSTIVTDGTDTALVDGSGNLSVICANCSGTGVSVNEDVASADSHPGTPAYTVRNNTLTGATSADGDYQPIKSTAAGAIYSQLTLGDSVASVGNGGQGGQTLRVTLANDSTGVLATVSTVTSLSQLGGTAVPVEDAAETAGGTGIYAMTVRRDTVASSAGTTGDNATLNTDSTGRLWARANGATTPADNFSIPTDAITVWAINGCYDGATIDFCRASTTTEATHDAALTAGSTVGFVNMMIAKDFDGAALPNAVSAEGDAAIPSASLSGVQYVMLVNEDGSLERGTTTTPMIVGDGTGALNVICDSGCSGGTQYVEDAAAASDPTGTVTIVVRKDTPASEVSADGDNIAARGTAYGAQYVTLLDTAGAPVSVGGGTQYDEDTAHVSGDKVNMAGVVQQSADTALAADGDRTAMQVDSSGFLKARLPSTQALGTVAAVTSITQLGGVAFPVEDAAETAGGTGIYAMTVRRDTASTSANNPGDNATLNTDGTGKLWVTGTQVEDVAHSTGDYLIGIVGRRIDTLAPSSGTSGDYETVNLNANGAVWTAPTASTNGGADSLKYTSAGATEDEHAVKASAGTLYSITVTNTNAAARYLRCENDTAANTTPGSETPELDLAIPGATAGAGFTTTFPMGYSFSTALTCWIVTGAADTDVAEVAANEIKVFYTFK